MFSADLLVTYLRIIIVEAAYWTVSISMVFINKYVLSDTMLGDELTVFITQFQCMFSLAILIVLNYLTKKFVATSHDEHQYQYEKQQNNASDIDNHHKQQHQTSIHEVNIKRTTRNSNSEPLSQIFHVYIPDTVKLSTCKIVFPVSLLYVGMLVLNNFCLKNVDVAFYFVSRSLTTVFNVIFTYFLLDETISFGALICCAFIVIGFFIGLDQENVIGKLSVIGVIFGVASSLFTSLFTIYTKKTLASLDKNIWILTLFNNINAMLLFVPLLAIHGDISVLIYLQPQRIVNPAFWTMLSISGVMAFFIATVTNASIKYTSPLTHNISGTAKACFQTVIAVIYDRKSKSFLWWTSNVIILLASAMYSRIKQQEMERRLNINSSNNSSHSEDDGTVLSKVKNKTRNLKKGSFSNDPMTINLLDEMNSQHQDDDVSIIE